MSAHEHKQATVLLAAWAVDVCPPEEAAFVEAHLARCAGCATEAASLRETAVRLAAVVPTAVPPPSVKQGLFARILDVPTAAPDAGSATGAAAEGEAAAGAATVWPPLRTYQRMVQRLDDVLGNLHHADWGRRAAADWTVQDLVIHLAAADEVLASWLRQPTGGPAKATASRTEESADDDVMLTSPAANPDQRSQPDDDGMLTSPAANPDQRSQPGDDGMLTSPAANPDQRSQPRDDGMLTSPAANPDQRSQPDDGMLTRLAANLGRRSLAALDRSRGEPPELTRAYWRGQADDIVRRALARRAALSGQFMPFGGVPMPVEHVLLDRAFETWIHGDDIATAVGIAFAPPSPDQMHLLAQTAMGVLPAAFAEAGRARLGAVAGVTLTGPGGGEWTVPFGPPDTGLRSTAIPTQRVAHVRLDVVEFCLLVGGRREVATLAAEISGDFEAGRDILVAAASLARP